ncbi:MAG TPA: amine oxidase, partial [Cyanobacteria bacterium UBA9273]|nr:amine oxidase [Cyanobacteria bacterium UBA9273]
MSRSLLFSQLARTIRIAQYCQENNISTSEGIERIAALEALMSARNTSRREFLAQIGKLAVVGATIGVGSGRLHRTLAATRSIDVQVAIIGAGLAGLACGYELKKNGINATLYEASNRLGGRCYSLGGAFPGTVTFPGQVVERGGEFIDNLHKTMLGYVQEFKLQVEDLS